MAAEWMKLDVQFLNSRKVRRAGADGAMLFIHLLSVVRTARRDGWCHADELEADVIFGKMAGLGWTLEQCAAAAEAVVRADLVSVDGDRLVIVGWSDAYRPTCSRCKQPNADAETSPRCPKCRKDKGKADAVPDEPEHVAQASAVGRSAAQKNAGKRSARACDALPDKSRAEQSRRDGREGGREEGFSLKQGESVPDTSAVPADSRPPPDPAAAERITATIHDISRRRAAT